MAQGLWMAMESASALGILWSVLALGVYLSYRVLDFADLTVEGTFALGGSVGAVVVAIHGGNPWLALLLAMGAGLLAGAVTGLLHTKLGIPGILSGILTMIALYSVNVRVMGRANTSLLGSETIFSQVQAWTGLSANRSAILVGVLLAILLVAGLSWFFRTEVGHTIRATGSNGQMVRALGGSTDAAKILGLMLSNGLAALAGALASQQQGYAQVDMGAGAIVIGLASVIIGEALLGRRLSLTARMAGAVVGSVLYRMAVGYILQLRLSWFQSTDLKLFTAILVALALSLPSLRQKMAHAARRWKKPAIQTAVQPAAVSMAMERGDQVC